MPNTPYTIDYSAPPAKINRDCDAIIAKLKLVETQAVKTAAVLKTLGQNTPGLTAALGNLKKIDVELRSKVTDAGKAATALAAVGKDNRAITSLTARLKDLEAELKRVTADATAAQAGLAGVGGGVNLPGSSGGSGGAASPGMGRRILGGVASHAIFAGGRAALGAMGNAGKEGTGLLSDSAQKVREFREGLREYASLRNKPGPNNDVVREALDFAKKGNVLPEEITPFLTNYEGSAATGRMAGNIGGTVGQGGFTAEKQAALEASLKVRGAQFATRTGLDAKTAGDLTGLVSTYKRINSESDLAGQLGGMHYGLDQGRGEITPLARGELGQAGSAIGSNRVSGLPELGAFIGVASVVSKSAASAGTGYGQMSRFLNESGSGNEVQEAFIKESGMGAAKGDFNKLKALRDHIAKVKPADVNSYLESKGYGNSTDRRSVIGMMGNVDVLEKRIAEANRIAGNGQDVIARDAANEKEEVAVNRRSETAEYTSSIELGMTSEKLAQGQQFARGRMMDPNQPGGQRLKPKGLGAVTDVWRGVAGFFQGVSPEEQRVNEDAIKALVEGGKKVGVDVARKYPKLANNNIGLKGEVQYSDDLASDFGKAASEVQAAGGNPFGGDAAQKLDQAGNLIKAAAKDVARGGKGGGGAPQGPAAGNGGAGVNPRRP